MSAGKWRLLNAGETIRGDDQWHDHKTNLWVYAHLGQGYKVETTDGPIRRRMTPAEEHAEELAQSLGDVIEKMLRIMNPRIGEKPVRHAGPVEMVDARRALEAAGIVFDKAKGIQ